MNPIDLTRVDLNLLVVFHALMQERQVTRAAVLLNVSQGAVSASLKRLRNLLDDPLFERTHGAMEPTPKALAMAPAISKALTTVARSLFDEPDFDPRTSTRTFHIALSDDIESVLMPWVIERSTLEGWKTQFAFHQTNSRFWAEAITSPRVDLVICSTPPTLSGSARSQLLFTGSYLCLYDPERLHLSHPITPAEYVSSGHIRVSYNAQRGFVDDLMEAQGTERIVHASVSHFSGIVTALRNAPVIATIPEHAARAFAAVAPLRVSRPPMTVPNYAVSMIWDVRRDSDAGHLWLRSIIEEFAPGATNDTRMPTAVEPG